MRIPVLLMTSALLAACTWVQMTPGGAAIRVARASEDLSACRRSGEVAVSVKDRLGPIQRNRLKVIDELEILARNEAVGLGADTIQAKSAPEDGEQRFLAYVCKGVVAEPTPVAEPADTAETYPMHDN